MSVERPPAARITLRPEEAAAALGVSRDTFDAEIRRELRVIRIGRRILVPVVELERWVERSAARVADDLPGTGR